MRVPDFKDFQEERAEGRTGAWRCSGSGLHPNPLYWKYDWWVFHQDSPVDGHAFLTASYRLSTHDALNLIDRIRATGGLCWTYNARRPRLDPEHTPFDPQHPRWKGVEWAPAYDQDPDPPLNGHK